MSADPEPPVPTLPLPPDGIACGVGCAVAFLGGTVALAASNLAAYRETHTVGIVASALWLALIAFCLTLGVRQVGVRGSVVSRAWGRSRGDSSSTLAPQPTVRQLDSATGYSAATSTTSASRPTTLPA